MKKIQILGMGCSRCHKLQQTAENAAKELGLAYEVERVTDLPKIMSFGVMSTPALVVDGVLKVSGKVPSMEEIKKLLA
ncbi:MAG: thioredoxin family protein [Verrucomicrobia bacterium Tous-C9LFEB]|nr:MAG: thioredoxin family protein [Verrucomicrobia bacterium Tous-C9LFEB]